MSKTKTSPNKVLDRRMSTLERRLDFLDGKDYQNSWDKAEIAALDLALEMMDRYQDEALKVIKEMSKGKDDSERVEA